MDRLIEDYKLALTEEFLLSRKVALCRERIAAFEAKEMYRLIEDDPKLAQWKAQVMLCVATDIASIAMNLQDSLRQAEYDHGRAKIDLLVATERLKLTRARLYGGHHEMLDMQEVAPPDDEAVA